MGTSSPECTGKVGCIQDVVVLTYVVVVNIKTVFGSDGEWLNGNCSVGQLTTTGFEQQLMNGQYLRKSYVESGFLSSCITPSEIYIRSDSMWF